MTGTWSSTRGGRTLPTPPQASIPPELTYEVHQRRNSPDSADQQRQTRLASQQSRGTYHVAHPQSVVSQTSPWSTITGLGTYNITQTFAPQDINYANFHDEISYTPENQLLTQSSPNLSQSIYDSGYGYEANGIAPSQTLYSHPTYYHVSPYTFDYGSHGAVSTYPTPQKHIHRARNTVSYRQTDGEYSLLDAGLSPMESVAGAPEHIQDQDITPPASGSTKTKPDVDVEVNTASAPSYKQYNDLMTPAACREWIAAYESKAGSKRLTGDTDNWKGVLNNSTHHIGQILGALTQKYDDSPIYRENVSPKDLIKYHSQQKQALDKAKAILEDDDGQKLAIAYATILFQAAVDLHRHGVKGESFKQLQNRANGKTKSKADGAHPFKNLIVDPLSCGDRIVAIIKSIQSHKNVALGLLEGNNLYDLAANPKLVLLHKANYDNSNRQRQKKIDQSRELMKAAREATGEAEEPRSSRRKASTPSVRTQSEEPPPTKKRKRACEGSAHATLALADTPVSTRYSSQQIIEGMMGPTMSTAVLSTEHIAADTFAEARGNHAELVGDHSWTTTDQSSTTEQGAEHPALDDVAASSYGDSQLLEAQPVAQPYVVESSRSISDTATTPHSADNVHLAATSPDPASLPLEADAEDIYLLSFGQQLGGDMTSYEQSPALLSNDGDYDFETAMKAIDEFTRSGQNVCNPVFFQQQ